eukprot:9007966-Pyramimonas_sp.AAC.1
MLGWCGQGAQKTDWRNKTPAITTASAVHLNIQTRVDKGVRTYVQSPKNGPEWGHAVRRMTTNLGDNAIIQDIKIQDQPTAYNYNAPLPD